MAIGVTVRMRTPTNPTQGMSRAETAAYNAQLTKCSTKAGAPLRVLARGSTQALASEWENIINATIASAQVRKANQRATACAAGTPFAATSVEDEMSRIASEVNPLMVRLKQRAARATERAGARVLIRCFGPEIALTTRLLSARRAVFFSENAQAIDQIEAEASRAATTLASHARAARTPG
jgi:hypothetical protein